MTRPILTDEQRRTICREMCEGVPSAQPTHPRLQRDVDNAYFTALKSPTFRAIVAGLHQQALPLELVGGPVVCLRRFDPVLRQMVFEPLPDDR